MFVGDLGKKVGFGASVACLFGATAAFWHFNSPTSVEETHLPDVSQAKFDEMASALHDMELEVDAMNSTYASQFNSMAVNDTTPLAWNLFSACVFLVVGALLHWFYSTLLAAGGAFAKVTIGNRNGSLCESEDPKERERRRLMDAERRRSYGSEYPNGWYFLIYSEDLKKGEVKLVTALGTQFAVFRGDKSGEISVLDPFCPHMGANLAVGGEVCDDSLVCPFHKWRFAADGECVAIPYSEAKKYPSNANARSYPSKEFCGMVCVYFDELGRPPAYSLPVQTEIDNGNMVYRGSLDAGSIHMHIQEFAENAADFMHFDPVHGRMMFPFTRITVPFIWKYLQIDHTPTVLIGCKDDPEVVEKCGPNDKHFLYFCNYAQLKWKGEVIPETDANAIITFCGPAGICFFTFQIPRFGKIILFHTHTPEGDMKLRVRFHWYAEKSMPRAIVWYVVGLWISQWSNDIDIWENKIFRARPCLVKGDGPIKRTRNWFKQFYATESEKAKHKMERAIEDVYQEEEVDETDELEQTALLNDATITETSSAGKDDRPVDLSW